jgi:hypothetical protein
VNTLHDWARKWGVSVEALEDLGRCLSAETPVVSGEGEADVLGHVRLSASRAGWRVFRNNVGATHTHDGRFIRYGLANDSKRVNESLKSSDLIGIRPVRIDPIHLGRTLGQFIAIECKRPGWRFTNTKREAAQQRFLLMIESLGGCGLFSTGGLE